MTAVRKLERLIAALEEGLRDTREKLAVAKQEACAARESEAWACVDVSYADVFIRIAKHIHQHGGFEIQVGDWGGITEIESHRGQINEESGGVILCLGESGECLRWKSVKSFLTAPLDEEHCVEVEDDSCANIFDCLGCWREDAPDSEHGDFVQFMDNLEALCGVEVKDESPRGLMDALDKGGIAVD